MSKLKKEEPKKIIKMVLETLITAVIYTVVIYLIIGPFNNTCVEILKSVNTNNSELNVIMCVLPILFIILFMLKLGTSIMTSNKSNQK